MVKAGLGECQPPRGVLTYPVEKRLASSIPRSLFFRRNQLRCNYRLAGPSPGESVDYPAQRYLTPWYRSTDLHIPVSPVSNRIQTGLKPNPNQPLIYSTYGSQCQDAVRGTRFPLEADAESLLWYGACV